MPLFPKRHDLLNAAVIAAAAVATLAPFAANAEVIITGQVNPATLTTNPTTTSQIIVSFPAAGTLTVNASPTGNGFTAINGNFAGSVGAVAGFTAGSNGQIFVTGNGTAGSASFTTQGSITLGSAGGTGSLSVTAGGLAQTTRQGAFNGSLIQAGNSNSTGTILVSGAGSALKGTDRVQVGAFTGSTGSLTVSNGALVQTTGTLDGTLEIGTGGSGTVSVTGANSKILANGVLLGNGTTSGSAATLSIQNGGLVSLSSISPGVGGGASIGGPSGTQLTVTGSGSTLQVGPITSGIFAGKELLVGGFAPGTLLVDQAGSVNAAGANINVSGGVNGTSTSSPGTMTVRNGATVTANTVTVYQNGVLNGNGTITGNVTANGGTIKPGNSPGTMTIAGDLNLLAGSLELEIASGVSDLLNVSGNIFVGPNFFFDLIFEYDPPFNTALNLEDFFIGFSSFAVDPAFDLASHLHFTGLDANDLVNVSLAGQTVALRGPAAVSEPDSFLLILLAFGVMARVMRRSQSSMA